MTLVLSDTTTIQFPGIRELFPAYINSAIRASWLLSKWFQDYLAFLKGDSKEEKPFTDVLIECEFSDISPGELRGLPPDRETKLLITNGFS